VLFQQQQELQAMREGRHPESPQNDPELLVIEVDGGRWQSRDKDEQSGSRWREDKVCTVVKYERGDGKEKEPRPLVSSCVGTTQETEGFGELCRLETERRGLRQAEEVVVIADGGNWIDPLLEREFRSYVRILDYYHAEEHLWEVARIVKGPEGNAFKAYGEKLAGWLWNGQSQAILKELHKQAEKMGPVQASDGREHPRRVLHQNVGYFTAHRGQMDYPAYRARGWPIGSGAVEAGVKQFNKRVKGTEQFWNEQTLEPILALRGLWLSQDERWSKYWQTRPAYQRAA
jgi:hypothetical protein